jgi:hypothetical protein
MALEQRGSGSYYYYKRKVDGKVVSEYGGSGLLGTYAAILDERERDKRSMERLELARFKQEQRRIDRAIDEHHSQVRQTVAAILQEAGFHKHHGQWRLKRCREPREVTSEMANEPAQMTIAAEAKEYSAFYRAAMGKPAKSKEMAQLREYAIKHPRVFDEMLSLRSSAIDLVIESASKDEAARVHLGGEADALKRALGIDTATPLERLLIEDVVVCSVRMTTMEGIYHNAYKIGDGVTFAKAAYLENRLTATRRRYLRSMEALARVRGLLARAGIQINIGLQQVNQVNS